MNAIDLDLSPKPLWTNSTPPSATCSLRMATPPPWLPALILTPDQRSACDNNKGEPDARDS